VTMELSDSLDRVTVSVPVRRRWGPGDFSGAHHEPRNPRLGGNCETAIAQNRPNPASFLRILAS